MRQIDQGLSSLEQLDHSELKALADIVERCLIPSSRMFSIESAEDLAIGIRSLKDAIVDDPETIELLLPAKLPRRLTPEERKKGAMRFTGGSLRD